MEAKEYYYAAMYLRLSREEKEPESGRSEERRVGKECT